MIRPVVIYTDGSASVKDRTGGWGFVARYGGKEAHRNGFSTPTTISIMEILAINKALHFLRPNSIPVSIFSDSKYAVGCLTEWGKIWERSGWLTSTGKPASNAELIRETMRLIERHQQFRKVDISWIKGHSGNSSNDLADKLAGGARRAGKGTWRDEDEKFHRLADVLDSGTR